MDIEKPAHLGGKVPSSYIDKELFENLKKTSAIIDRPEKFAQMFCSVADTQIDIRQKLSSILLLSIQKDIASRDEIKKVLIEIYKEDWRRFVRSAWGKIGFVVWTLFTALFSAWLGTKFK